MNFRKTNRQDNGLALCAWMRWLHATEHPWSKHRLSRTGHSRKDDGEQGNALVELAVVLPMMMLLITAMVTFGLWLNTYLVLSHATDVGARNLAVSRGATLNPCSDAVTLIQSAAPNLAASGLTYTFNIGSGTFSGSSTGFSGTNTTSCSVAGVGDMVAGANASVSVTYPFQMLVYGWRATTVNITTTTTEVIQ